MAYHKLSLYKFLNRFSWMDRFSRASRWSCLLSWFSGQRCSDNTRRTFWHTMGPTQSSWVWNNADYCCQKCMDGKALFLNYRPRSARITLLIHQLSTFEWQHVTTPGILYLKPAELWTEQSKFDHPLGTNIISQHHGQGTVTFIYFIHEIQLIAKE